MPLTPAQLSTLKTHLLANTNTIGGVAINSLPPTPDNFFAIADWYNGVALAGDNQPFSAPLTVWNPNVTIDQLTAAINWGQDPAGADTPTKTLAILKWQSMCWNNKIDMTDNQNRAGIASVWGSASSSNSAIKAVGAGRKAATRFEMLFAGPSRGPNGAAADADNALNGRVTPFYWQRLFYTDIEAALTV
jgi:hypothetical protein